LKLLDYYLNSINKRALPVGVYKMSKQQFEQVCNSFLIDPQLLMREPQIQKMISNGISREQLTAYLSVAIQLMGVSE
jgi:hypothetical protein